MAERDEKRGQGRPSSFTPEIADAVCASLAEGHSLRSTCRPDDMPSVSMVCRWLGDDKPGFREQYARAREAQAEFIAEDAFELADSMLGAGREDNAAVQAARLAVDTRKWFLARMSPRVYGDRQRVETVYPEGIPAVSPDIDNSPEAIKATHDALQEAGYFEQGGTRH